jgi:hypothetical protein
LPWWLKALVGSVAAVASITAVMAIRLWPGESTFHHMKPQSALARTPLQQQAQTSTLRMLTDRKREQEARQALQQANRQATVDADSQLAAAHHRSPECERKKNAWRGYYKAPAQCDKAYQSVDIADCMNRYIAAKRAFEAKFAAEKL